MGTDYSLRISLQLMVFKDPGHKGRTLNWTLAMFVRP